MSHAKCFLCRCEDVTLDKFRSAFQDGFTEFESLKRYTGLGTGFCQGKGCLAEAALELAALRRVDPAEMAPPTIRPPAEPVTFAELAALDPPSVIQPNSDPDAAPGKDTP